MIPLSSTLSGEGFPIGLVSCHEVSQPSPIYECFSTTSYLVSEHPPTSLCTLLESSLMSGLGGLKLQKFLPATATRLLIILACIKLPSYQLKVFPNQRSYIESDAKYMQLNTSNDTSCCPFLQIGFHAALHLHVCM